MGLNILILDDDRYLVEKVSSGIDWESLQIRQVFTAENIREAMEILVTCSIKILISDIEMPMGSGLELLEWIREKGMDVECIFLSSYAHFAYAQKALALNCRNYLLKPVSNKDLTEAIRRLRIADQKAEEEAKHICENASETFWKKFMSGIPQEDALMKEEERAYFARESHKRFALCLLRMLEGIRGDHVEKAFHNRREKEMQHFILEKMTREFLVEEKIDCVALIRQNDDIWMLVIHVTSDDMEKMVKNKLKMLLMNLQKMLSGRTCLYYGNAGGLAQLPQSRECLENMMNNAIIGKEGYLLEEMWRNEDHLVTKELMNQVEKQLLEAKIPDRAYEESRELVKLLWNRHKATVKVFSQIRQELHQIIVKYLVIQNLLFTKLYDISDFDRHYKEANRTLEGMERYIAYLFEKLIGYENRSSKSGSVVEQLKYYIDEHIEEELSRKQLSKLVFLSEDYISKLFVKEAGVSIPSYVAGRRMDKAQHYLAETEWTVSQIALKTGYINFSYFSKTFRDFIGCTPNEYRNRYRGNIRNDKKAERLSES